MSGGAFRYAGAAMLALLIACATPTLASAASATQQRDDRANHDRWARAAPSDRASSSSDSSGEDADADDDSGHHHHANASETPPRHKGELNGKLHMGEWS